jgi:hypothetical protein
MKFFLIGLITFFLGYAVYPYINKIPASSDDELYLLFKKFLNEEGRSFADAHTPEAKLKAADAMYEKMMLLFLAQLKLEAPENRPLSIQVDIHPEKKEFQKKALPTIPARPREKSLKEMTIPERIFLNKLDSKTAMGFYRLPTLGLQDSRLLKLNGTFIGKLKLTGESRTGGTEKITLVVNRDKNKSSTKLEAVDEYDNSTLDYTVNTAESFRSIPGDENYLLLSMSDQKFLMIDLRGYPTLSGKMLDLNVVKGDFTMKKTNP